MMVFYVMIDKGQGWQKPMFPKSCKNISRLEKDSIDLLRVYERVGIFENGDILVKELYREEQA